MTLIPTLFSRQGVKAPLTIAIELAAQGFKGGFTDSSVREGNLLVGQLLEKLVGQLRFDLIVNERR